MKIKTIVTALLIISLKTMGFFYAPVSHAEEVTLEVAPNLMAKALFNRGSNDVAVLVNHGFLTTNKFSTIQSILSVLNDQGYTTLAPNLTLGINLREHSLKCNSLHTHTLASDVNEINQWIHWLNQQGFKKIVLLGHSSGSQEILVSQATSPNPTVKLAIFTSLFYLNGLEPDGNKQDIEKAQALLSKGKHTPQKYSFLFCQHNYLATPDSFLSYQQLTREQSLINLNLLKIPNYTIMGSADRRYQNVGYRWLNDLEETQTHVVIIKGANHFFSSEYEFDLQEEILKIITENVPA